MAKDKKIEAETKNPGALPQTASTSSPPTDQEPNEIPKVTPDKKVTITDLTANETYSVILIKVENPHDRRIAAKSDDGTPYTSIDSVIGKAILGKQKGEADINVTLPNEEIHLLKIVDIEPISHNGNGNAEDNPAPETPPTKRLSVTNPDN